PPSPLHSFPTRRSSDLAGSPVGRLVLAPVGMDLLRDFRRQCVCQAFHRSPRERRRAMTSFYSHRARTGTVAFEKKNGQKRGPLLDRKSTRLNSSHEWIS